MVGPKIVVRQLSLSFGRKPVLRDVSVEAEPGSSLALIGPNGAGKTTLVGCLLGLLRPDSGEVQVDGLAPSDIEARRCLGYVPERPSFDRNQSARSIMKLHHSLASLATDGRTADVELALESVGLAAEADQVVRRYSKGMLQRLSFAAALLGRPRWLVLDEPFSGVDPAGVVLLRKLLNSARERGTTIVMNSHRLDQVGRLCDRAAIISRGQIRAVHDCEPGSQGVDETLEALVLALDDTGAAA